MTALEVLFSLVAGALFFLDMVRGEEIKELRRRLAKLEAWRDAITTPPRPTRQ